MRKIIYFEYEVEIYINTESIRNAQAGLVPLLATLLPRHQDVLLPVVTHREVELSLLAQMHLQLVFALLQDDLLAGLDPLPSLLLLFVSPVEPHPHPTGRVVDIRSKVFLVVGRVVLPGIEVPPGGGGDSEVQL